MPETPPGLATQCGPMRGTEQGTARTRSPLMMGFRNSSPNDGSSEDGENTAQGARRENTEASGARNSASSTPDVAGIMREQSRQVNEVLGTVKELVQIIARQIGGQSRDKEPGTKYGFKTFDK